MLIRISSARIENLRNVALGEVSLSPGHDNVLGLYGQNGSGKTTFIFALELLKTMLSGAAAKGRFSDLVSVDAQASSITFEFSVFEDGGQQSSVVYSASIGRDVFCESLKIALPDTRKNDIINCDLSDEGALFAPAAKKRELFGTSKKLENKLMVAKLLCAKEQRSFIFSDELSAHLLESRAISDGSHAAKYREIILALREYGRQNLLVVTNRASGLISLNLALPVMIRNGLFPVPIDKPFVVQRATYERLRGVFEGINSVLCEIIPGMELNLHSFGEELLEDGSGGIRLQMVRPTPSGRHLPLKHESEGIKKIVSILHLLIAAFNNPSVTLAVDELDSGIFEYLLGELLSIMQNRAKGQLIFTSHNLFPLEKLDKHSVVLTTANPNNRYIRMSDIRPSNNMRSCYLREVALGRDKGEDLYRETDSIEIAYAMRRAKSEG